MSLKVHLISYIYDFALKLDLVAANSLINIFISQVSVVTSPKLVACVKNACRKSCA